MCTHARMSCTQVHARTRECTHRKWASAASLDVSELTYTIVTWRVCVCVCVCVCACVRVLCACMYDPHASVCVWHSQGGV